jgi:hypothetical protein
MSGMVRDVEVGRGEAWDGRGRGRGRGRGKWRLSQRQKAPRTRLLVCWIELVRIRVEET